MCFKLTGFSEYGDEPAGSFYSLSDILTSWVTISFRRGTLRKHNQILWLLTKWMSFLLLCLSAHLQRSSSTVFRFYVISFPHSFLLNLFVSLSYRLLYFLFLSFFAYCFLIPFHLQCSKDNRARRGPWTISWTANQNGCVSEGCQCGKCLVFSCRKVCWRCSVAFWWHHHQCSTRVESSPTSSHSLIHEMNDRKPLVTSVRPYLCLFPLRTVSFQIWWGPRSKILPV